MTPDGYPTDFDALLEHHKATESALDAAQQENARLAAERDTFYMDYRIKCDAESRAALIRAESAEAQRDALRAALNNLRNEAHAMLALAYDAMKAEAGYTNVKCLQDRLDEAYAALAALPAGTD